LKIVKPPSPMCLLCGGALAYWLADIINPAFVAIAIMIVLIIPIFITDYFSDQLVEVDTNQQLNRSNHSPHQPIDNPTTNRLQLLGKHSTPELLKDDEAEAEIESVDQRAKLTK